MSNHYPGVYEAVVHDLDDPLQEGRARLLIPSVLGRAVSGWARPVLGKKSTTNAKVGDRVWMQFEHGDRSRATWFPHVVDLQGAPVSDEQLPSRLQGFPASISDFNNATASGKYSGTNLTLNTPTTGWWYLEVVAYTSSNNLMQRANKMNTNDWWQRYRDTSTVGWSPWVQTDFQDTGWLALPLANNWVVYDSSQWLTGYRRKDGMVYLRGLVKNSVSTTQTIMTLPVGFRPLSHNIFPAVHAGNAATWLYVQQDGAVHAPSGTVNSAWLSLSGVVFPAER